MNEKYTNAFIDSTNSYLFKLRKLARQDVTTLRDLSLLEILLQIYNWADWFEVSENDKIHIQKLLDCIYLRNPNLALPTVIPGVYYSNVSTPQTIWTWQRIWDNLDGTTGVIQPEDYYINVTPSSTIRSSSSGTATFAVSANTTWAVTSSHPWCYVSISGNNIIASYSSNVLATSRTATITVTDTGGHSVPAKTVTLTQSAATTILSVTPSLTEVSSNSGTTNFTVVSNASWTAVSDSAWCTVTASGTGNGPIIASFSRNSDPVTRTANITVSAPGATPVVVQLTQSSEGAYLIVTPSFRSISAATTSTSFDVESNVSWTTSIIGTNDWCSATASGSNNGTIEVTCVANVSITPRSVTIRVSSTGLPSVDVTVTQTGVGAQLSVTPSTRNVSDSSGSTTFSITSNAAWSASSNASWCTVPSSGSGNATLTATYTQNTLETSRTATITITTTGLSPIQVTVVQDGFVPVGDLTVLQGYIYNMPALFDSRKISSSDAWVVTTTSPQDSANSAADYTNLYNYVTPNFLNLLHDYSNSLGFDAYVTNGRRGTGIFTIAGEYPAGSILMSPYYNQTTATSDYVTFIGNYNSVPTMTTYEISDISFPVRLVKRTTSLANGESGTYIGNNGVEYPTICINGREWLAANLIETNYRNGDSIPEIVDNTLWNRNMVDGIGQRCSYNNNEENAFIRTTR